MAHLEGKIPVLQTLIPKYYYTELANDFPIQAIIIKKSLWMQATAASKGSKTPRSFVYHLRKFEMCCEFPFFYEHKIT